MKLEQYNSKWKKFFEKEKKSLKNIFGDEAIEIQHIGSTAIPGIRSKPIIDIAIMIKNQKNADQFTPKIIQIDYQFHSSSTERHFYIKRGPINYNLSIAYADRGGFWDRQILFRDYLINHPDAAQEYEEVKNNLIKKYPSGKDEYTYGKSEFINRILKKCKK